LNKRYLCSRHSESTPSVVVYPDHGWCFGCCQKIPLNELGISPQEAAREACYIEDLEATLNYISNLPKKEIRGFNLSFNDRGYYLVFPTLDYYKFRSLDSEAKSKYRGPSGHSKPWFRAQITQSSSLVLVEGEFNALSLGKLGLPVDVVSPGGAGDFYSRTGKQELLKCLQYSAIHVIVDSDAAGAQAAIETKAFLVANGHNDVRIHLVETDFNDIHVKEGIEKLREKVKAMGLST
jgi:hypothetical protein